VLGSAASLRRPLPRRRQRPAKPRRTLVPSAAEASVKKGGIFYAGRVFPCSRSPCKRRGRAGHQRFGVQKALFWPPAILPGRARCRPSWRGTPGSHGCQAGFHPSSQTQEHGPSPWLSRGSALLTGAVPVYASGESLRVFTARRGRMLV